MKWLYFASAYPSPIKFRSNFFPFSKKDAVGHQKNKSIPPHALYWPVHFSDSKIGPSLLVSEKFAQRGNNYY
ncbi:hypothetical protein C9374_008822 [Naegleria lovaniensis]|uniref:Uncharacterized protein n=1 Tax=Naegleria lovaniensis TaxID=51637 RepID=A0AA88GE22_NAELO|nr:uncharacterized protein C9374_008822 [Naegleria lovaniensis]KAG2377737.1 hypothetical protein C9374_008822 [Naegleria lovaniensis]